MVDGRSGKRMVRESATCGLSSCQHNFTTWLYDLYEYRLGNFYPSCQFHRVGNVEGIRRISRAGLHIVLVMATFASLIFFSFTEDLVHLFTPDTEVALAAVPLIIPLILYQYCDAAQLTYVNALRGTSVVKPLLWISTVSYLVVGIPVLLLFGVTLGWETEGVYYSFSVALLTATILLVTTFRRVLKGKELEIGDKNAAVKTL